MVEIMREAVAKANTEHRMFEDQLKKRRAAFAEQLRQWQEEVDAFAGFGDILKRNQLSETASDLMERLRNAHTEAEEINGQEKMFGWAQTKYTQLAQMTQKLEPFLSLWKTTAVFYDRHHDWMNGPFSRLDAEVVENEVMDAFRKLYKLQKMFAGAGGAEQLPQPLEVANVVMARIEGFKEHLPLIMAICNPGLRDRHWAKIADIVGLEIKPDAVTSLKYLLDKEVGSKVKEVEQVSDNASREWSIEKQLDKMLTDWDGLAFELGEWKDTGTYILKGGPVDEAQMLLDDHLVKSQAMTASPFARPFEDRLIPWERKLRRLQDILDQWLKCQGKWLYLEPIFGSEEIMKQIPKEGAAFRAMDNIWRGIMNRVKENPVVVEASSRGSRTPPRQGSAGGGTSCPASGTGPGDPIGATGGCASPLFHPGAGRRVRDPARGPHSRQRRARRRGEGPERLFGHQEAGLPALLLPVQRRASRDPVRGQGPAQRPAVCQEVLRGCQGVPVREQRRDLGHDVGRGREHRLDRARQPW